MPFGTIRGTVSVGAVPPGTTMLSSVEAAGGLEAGAGDLDASWAFADLTHAQVRKRKKRVRARASVEALISPFYQEDAVPVTNVSFRQPLRNVRGRRAGAIVRCQLRGAP